MDAVFREFQLSGAEKFLIIGGEWRLPLINIDAHLLATPLVIHPPALIMIRLADVGWWVGTTLNYKQPCISQECFAFAPSALLLVYLNSAQYPQPAYSYDDILSSIAKDSRQQMGIMKIRIALSIFVMELCFPVWLFLQESAHIIS